MSKRIPWTPEQDSIIANWARKGTAFSMDEKSIGMVREGLNAAHRLMVKQAGRMAA